MLTRCLQAYPRGAPALRGPAVANHRVTCSVSRPRLIRGIVMVLMSFDPLEAFNAGRLFTTAFFLSAGTPLPLAQFLTAHHHLLRRRSSFSRAPDSRHVQRQSLRLRPWVIDRNRDARSRDCGIELDLLVVVPPGCGS